MPNTPRYGWLITEDLLAAQYGDLSNESGVCGPNGIDPAVRAKLDAGSGLRFRMYDDEELYYEGRYLHLDFPEVPDFEPLDDFGMPNAGCTRIDFYNPETRQWETL
jgi:hypothetical protein